MGHLDNASATDRPTTVLVSRPDDRTGNGTPSGDAAGRTPDGERREPRDRVEIALLAVVTAVAAAAIATVVVVTSGGDDSSTADAAIRTPAVTAGATTDPAVPTPGTATDPAPTTTAGTPAPGDATTPAAGSPGAATSATAAQAAGWEPRTFQGVTFAVPPGATAPDLADPGNADAPALFSWTGPSLGGEIYSHVSMWIYPADGAPTPGPEYQSITVPGADQARMWTGPTGSEPASITVDVHVLAGSRFINVVATVAPGAAGEQTVRDLVASLAVG
jgi:hypothetical protein